MNDIMLDLETMGTTSNAAIVAIGAVKFNPETGELGERFYTAVDLESSKLSGGIVDPETVQWWSTQSEQARKALENGISLPQALADFAAWVGVNRRVTVMWGNGSDFDNVILGNSYRRLGFTHAQLPWSYGNNRCFRTMKALYFDVPYPERVGVQHHALDDAVTQATHLLAIFQVHNARKAG